jgi:membrane protease YdiL (CAAX protease family)
MLGLLVIIVISWLLLRFFEKKNINVLGIIPNNKIIIQFLIGLVFMTAIALLTTYIDGFVLSINRQLNSNINYTSILNSFGYHLRSALTEDLVFRGAILYIFIQRIGTKKAIIISGIVFGIYHIFSYGMLNENWIAILYIILITGFTGYVWAYTFDKTKSIMMPLGFHLGHNFIITLFYKSQPYGELIYTEVSKVNLIDWNWLFYNLGKGLLPSILTLVFVKILLKQNLKFLPKKIQ